MPLSFNDNVMSEIVLNSIEEVSVIDVYDLASDIGAECEKLIDLYGSHSVKSLIPKCITALEMLEALASKNERENSIIQDLNDRIAKLEDEKAERAETKRKFEKVIKYVRHHTNTSSRRILCSAGWMVKRAEITHDATCVDVCNIKLRLGLHCQS